MHAPYAAQYWVIGGSGAGSGGSVTPGPWAVCGALAAAVSEAPAPALVDDAAVAAVVADAALFVAVAAAGALATGALAAGAVAAAGMLAPIVPIGPIGVAEKLLGGNGGRDGIPVDEVFVGGGARGGICDSWAMLIFVCLLAVA